MLKRGLIAGIVILVVGQVLNFLGGMLVPGIMQEYQNTAIFRPWSDPLMMMFFGYPFILGVVLSYLWERLKKPDELEFAKLYFLIATIPGMFITYTSFQVSLGLVILWTLTGFVEAYMAGWVFKKVK